jgi:hypothetical protein
MVHLQGEDGRGMVHLQGEMQVERSILRVTKVKMEAVWSIFRVKCRWKGPFLG